MSVVNEVYLQVINDQEAYKRCLEEVIQLIDKRERSLTDIKKELDKL